MLGLSGSPNGIQPQHTHGKAIDLWMGTRCNLGWQPGFAASETSSHKHRAAKCATRWPLQQLLNELILPCPASWKSRQTVFNHHNTC